MVELACRFLPYYNKNNYTHTKIEIYQRIMMGRPLLNKIPTRLAITSCFGRSILQLFYESLTFQKRIVSCRVEFQTIVPIVIKDIFYHA